MAANLLLNLLLESTDTLSMYLINIQVDADGYFPYL